MAASNLTTETTDENHGIIEALSFSVSHLSRKYVLKDEQIRVISEFSAGIDVFVNLQTGYGKSLCYMLIPYFCDYIRFGHKAINNGSVLLLISPLISLMEDQKKAIENHGLSCTKLTPASLQDKELMEGVYSCEYKVIIMSPEALEDNSVKKAIFKIKKNVVCVAVDEAHCIEQWGFEFRTAYGKLGKVRSLLMPGVPVIALTATATERTTSTIIETLEMKGCSIVRGSNNRKNISYYVKKLPSYQDYDFEKQEQVFGDCFKHIISDLQRNGLNSQKYLIFCYSKANCVDIFEYFERKLQETLWVSTDNGEKQRIIEMYVKETDDITKKNVIERFTSKDGSLHIVVATVVFGMGVDCPNIREVIHFRAPPSLMDYMQESGRAGRDGLPSKASLFYSSKEFGNRLSKLKKKGRSSSEIQIKDLQDMKMYCENNSACRRNFLLEHFDGSHNAKTELSLNNMNPKHICCDICSLTCTCDNCKRLEDKTLSQDSEQSAMTSSATSEKKRVPLSSCQKQVLKQKLEAHRSILIDGHSILGVDYSTGFTHALINNVIDLCDELFSIDDVLSKLDVWSESQAQTILSILSQATEDKEVEDLSLSQNSK